ncbi:hypothetical protein LCGC14_1054250 [marine sediment metagenome]|uniref:Ku domain-containing protein n=1 Tax=marine sediment metagenome TaxID=412755 RepID=A0A0F9QTZ6_9ZZZZ
MFKEPVHLTRAISLNDLYSYNIESTYLLKSQDNSSLSRLYKICEKLLEQDKLYRFTYAYYDTTNPRDAILIPKNSDLIMMVGESVELIMLKPTEILYSDIEEEELEQEISFEVW